MAPAGVCCGIGMFLFGYTLARGSPAELCAFFQGLQMVGVLIGIFSTLSYGLDSFRSQSNEIFVMNMLFKVSTQRNVDVDFSDAFSLRTLCFMAFPTTRTPGWPATVPSRSCTSLAALRSSSRFLRSQSTSTASVFEAGGLDTISLRS